MLPFNRTSFTANSFSARVNPSTTVTSRAGNALPQNTRKVQFVLSFAGNTFPPSMPSGTPSWYVNGYRRQHPATAAASSPFP